MPPKRKAEADASSLRRSARTRGPAAPKPELEPAPALAPAPTRKAKTGKATARPAKASRRADKAPAKNVERRPPAAPASPAAQPADGDERQYWLLKAEPESRFENGVDVRFSIDDLAACTEPEPWDGIRNYAARNNLRQMKRGDLAFFYHSNTKEPGIVGTMTIVQEHSPDWTAHDPKAAYYDPAAAADAAAGKDPRWSVVHVQFRSKLDRPITLRDLRAMGAPGQPLENMQMLRQSRLSVSRVSAAEWKHLLGVAKAT